MATHGRGRIRSIPKSQGEGLGVYAEDEIWHGQELLLANRDYPTEEEATARENIPEVREDGTEDEEVLGADEDTGKEAQEESRGHQYATCDDTGGWRMLTYAPMDRWNPHPAANAAAGQQHTTLDEPHGRVSGHCNTHR